MDVADLGSKPVLIGRTVGKEKKILSNQKDEVVGVEV